MMTGIYQPGYTQEVNLSEEAWWPTRPAHQVDWSSEAQKRSSKAQKHSRIPLDLGYRFLDVLVVESNSVTPSLGYLYKPSRLARRGRIETYSITHPIHPISTCTLRAASRLNSRPRRVEPESHPIVNILYSIKVAGSRLVTQRGGGGGGPRGKTFFPFFPPTPNRRWRPPSPPFSQTAPAPPPPGAPPGSPLPTRPPPWR